MYLQYYYQRIYSSTGRHVVVLHVLVVPGTTAVVVHFLRPSCLDLLYALSSMTGDCMRMGSGQPPFNSMGAPSQLTGELDLHQVQSICRLHSVAARSLGYPR